MSRNDFEGINKRRKSSRFSFLCSDACDVFSWSLESGSREQEQYFMFYEIEKRKHYFFIELDKYRNETKILQGLKSIDLMSNWVTINDPILDLGRLTQNTTALVTLAKAIKLTMPTQCLPLILLFYWFHLRFF